jgi:predicted RNA-binding protein YlqC (UPF0109 family)
MKRPQRFTRHPIQKITDIGMQWKIEVLVQPNDMVALVGTRGKYAQVLKTELIRQKAWWDTSKTIQVLRLTLRPLFRGVQGDGLIAYTWHPYTTSTGWQRIVKPISQEVVDEVNAILPYNLQINLEGKLSEKP